MTRRALASPSAACCAVAACLVACLASLPAEARRKPADAASPAAGKADAGNADKGKADPAKPVEVGTYGDWGAYLAKGKTRTCYALAKPKDRKPDGKKDAAYVFIADRPGEKVHNEVSIMMGFPIKESGTAQARVGSTIFALVAKGSNAWIKNPTDEARFVEALQHSARLTIKVPPVPQAGARARRPRLQVGGQRPSPAPATRAPHGFAGRRLRSAAASPIRLDLCGMCAHEGAG